MGRTRAQKLVRSAEERLTSVGLLQEAAVIVQFVPKISRAEVARGEDYTQIRTELSQALGELSPAHSRKDDIGDDQVNWLARALGKINRFFRAARRYHRVSRRRKKFAGQFANGVFIFDDEHSLTTA